MEGAVLVLVALACPLGMGLCMWLMARGMRGHAAERDTDDQKSTSLAELRAEQERLAGEIARVERDAGNGVDTPSSKAPVERA